MLSVAKVNTRVVFIDETGIVYEDTGAKSLTRHFVRNELCRKLIKRLVRTMDERYSRYLSRVEALSKELSKAKQEIFNKNNELYSLRKKLKVRK